MADSFLGIFNNIGDSIDGLFNSVKEVVGLDTSPTDSAGDFFGNKVKGALFNGGGSLSSSKSSTTTRAPDYGMISAGRVGGKSTDVRGRAAVDPRAIEKEWTERLWRFSNMEKMINNTAGKLPNG